MGRAGCPFYRVPVHGSCIAQKACSLRNIPWQLPCSSTPFIRNTSNEAVVKRAARTGQAQKSVLLTERPAVVRSQTYMKCKKQWICLCAWWHTVHEDVLGNGGIAARIFYVGIRWELLAYIPPAFLVGKTSSTPLDTRVCAPHSRHGLYNG